MNEDQLNNAKVEEQDNPADQSDRTQYPHGHSPLSTETACERGLLIEHELTRVLQQRKHHTR